MRLGICIGQPVVVTHDVGEQFFALGVYALFIAAGVLDQARESGDEIAKTIVIHKYLILNSYFRKHLLRMFTQRGRVAIHAEAFARYALRRDHGFAWRTAG